MSSFTKALEAKIKSLRSEREGHLSEISAIDTKLELLEELLLEEGGELPPTAEPKKKRPGRPRGSKNKKTATKPKASSAAVDDDLYKEAMSQLGSEGTTPEQQERLTKRFAPSPRPEVRLPSNVRGGRKHDVLAAGPDADTRISVEDDEGVED